MPSAPLTIGSGPARVQRRLAPRLARAQQVEAHPRDDRRQPAAQVLDPGRAGAAEPQPGLLDGIVRFAERAEHPVGHRPKVVAFFLEPLRQPGLFVHGDIPSTRTVIALTNGFQLM